MIFFLFNFFGSIKRVKGYTEAEVSWSRAGVRAAINALFAFMQQNQEHCSLCRILDLLDCRLCSERCFSLD